MKLSWNWLQELCAFEWSVDQLAEKLTMSGTEVEGIDRKGFSGDGVVTAKIVSFIQHPNADRLSVCQVDDGQGMRQIVCGAKNFKAGDVVPLAQPGATLPNGMSIKKSKLRGETSEGMLCSAAELGMAADAVGLMILDPETKPGIPFKELAKGDTVIEVEVTPNRADLLSHYGVARELTAIGAKWLDGKQALPEWSASGTSPVQVAVDDAADCPRYTACVLTGVKVGPSPSWLVEKLESAGLRAVNNVVDVTNYVLMEYGQPLHGFDAAKLSKAEGGRFDLQVRRAKEGETFLALDGKTHELKGSDLVIASGGSAVALAGVMGGELSGVSGTTTEVVLESAAFKPMLVRATSRRLGLISDSSYRFERGIDPRLVDAASARAVQLLQELAGARVAGQPVESSPAKWDEPVVALRQERIVQVLGLEVPPSRVDDIFIALGCRKEALGQWEIPSHRPDIRREIDLIEEVSRIEGLAKVPARLPGGIAPRSQADRDYELEQDLRSVLVANGFYEMETSSLLPAARVPEAGLFLGNPMTQDHAALRFDLLSTLLPCVQRNLARQQGSVLGFEIGRVFRAEAKTEGRWPNETKRLGVVMAGMLGGLHWKQAPGEADYFALKGVWEMLKKRCPGLTLQSGPEAVDPAVLKAYDLKVPVYAFEAELPLAEEKAAAVFKPMGNFPAVRRDLALVVDRAVTHEKLGAALRGAGVDELEAVECFDVFLDESGAKLAKEKKSVAYALTFRSPERTLTESEVAGWEQKILANVRETTGAQLR
jgi:phenylalanyl-tRNA synthetase beta chain